MRRGDDVAHGLEAKEAQEKMLNPRPGEVREVAGDSEIGAFPFRNGLFGGSVNTGDLPSGLSS
jgi:hypothetical protein